VSEPTAGELALAIRLGVDAAAIAKARDTLNTIASLPWPRPERVSLLARLAHATGADVGPVMGGLAIDAAPLASFDHLIPIRGISYKRVAGLMRALSRFDVAEISSEGLRLRTAWATIATLRAENDALRAEIKRLNAAPPGEAVMRLRDVATSLGAQLTLVDDVLRSRPDGLRLSGVHVRLAGAGAALDGDVALDLASPLASSAIGVSFVPRATFASALREARVPDVRGYTTALAKRKLAASGFAFDVANIPGSRGLVGEQQPPAGALAPEGSAVRLVVRDADALVFDPPPGPFTRSVAVSIKSFIPRTSIRYTTDGTDPTEETGTPYSGPVTLTATTTLKARAFRAGPVAASVAAADYISIPAMEAEFVGQVVPSRMVSGAKYEVSITMRNVGHSTWTPATSTPVRLGAQNPENTPRWGVTRCDLRQSVAPGDTATFQFMVVAPAPGVHAFQWQLVQGPQTWFGAPTESLAIDVRPASASVYDRSLAAGIGGNQL
jgi:hypothetical protein